MGAAGPADGHPVDHQGQHQEQGEVAGQGGGQQGDGGQDKGCGAARGLGPGDQPEGDETHGQGRDVIHEAEGEVEVEEGGGGGQGGQQRFQGVAACSAQPAVERQDAADAEEKGHQVERRKGEAEDRTEEGAHQHLEEQRGGGPDKVEAALLQQGLHRFAVSPVVVDRGVEKRVDQQGGDDKKDNDCRSGRTVSAVLVPGQCHGISRWPPRAGVPA